MADGPPGAAADVLAVACRYRLRLHGHRFRGHLGAQRSVAAGGALEFRDFRDYMAGDDVRHVDWRGFARHEQLRVRQFEAEVAPRVELLVDTSPSMVVTPAKAAAVRELVAAIGVWARGEGMPPRLLCLGGDEIAADALPLGNGPAAPALPLLPLRRGGVRILLSDALWPQSPQALLHGLCAGAEHVVCLQLLDPWELAPEVGATLTLVDIETGERSERRLDAATVAGYRERLERLCDGVRATILGAGGVHALVVAQDLAGMCGQALLPAGVLEPA